MKENIEEKHVISQSIFEQLVAQCPILSTLEIVGKEINHSLAPGGINALMFCAINGYSEAMQILIDNGANFNHADQDGDTILIRCVRNGHVDATRTLLMNNVDLEKSNKFLETALIEAVSEGFEEIVRLLIDSGANIEAEDIDGETAVFAAVERGDLNMLKLLASYNANLSKENFNGSTPLSLAEFKQQWDVISYMMNDYESETLPESTIAPYGNIEDSSEI